MYASNQTSVSYSTTLLADSGIIGIVNMADSTQQAFGDWEYNYHGGWHRLSEMPAKLAVKLGRKSLIRYVPKPGVGRYGLRILNFFEDTESENAPGDFMAIPGKISMHLAMLLVHPVPVESNFIVNHQFEEEMEYELMEDQKYGRGIPISRFVHAQSPVIWNPIPIPERYSHFINREDYRLFEESVQIFKMSRPVAKVNTDLSEIGRLKVVFNMDGGIYLLPTGKYIPLDFKNSSLVFVPNQNIYGQFTIELSICHCLTGDEAGMQNVTLPVTVYPVNDFPTVSSQTTLLPPIPFDNAEVSNNSFLISDIVGGFAYDPENHEHLGLAIFSMPDNQELGKWQYFDNNADSWLDIVVENQLNPFKILQPYVVGEAVDGMKASGKKNEEFYGYRLQKNIEYYTSEELQRQETGADEKEAYLLNQGLTLSMLLLENDQRIRFQLSGDVLWKRSDSLSRSFLSFAIWDGHDGLSSGTQYCTTIHYLK